MARRKWRRTKRSHSQSTAARRRLTLGDIVRVKDEVRDPDYDGYSIGGWSGAIIAFETWGQTPMALIEWDATTQHDRIDPEVRRRATSQGLSATQMWLHLNDLEQVDGVKALRASSCSRGGKGLSHPPRPGRRRRVVIPIPMCCGFATRSEPMGRLCGLPIVAIAAVPRSPFRRAFWPRSCDATSKPRALCRGLLRMRSRLFVSVQSDDSIRVAVPGHGGSGGGGAKSRATWVIHWPQNPVECPHLITLWRGLNHGLTSFLLPTRSIGTRVALRHLACRWVSPRDSLSAASHTHPAQAHPLQRAQSVRGSDAQAPLRLV